MTRAKAFATNLGSSGISVATALLSGRISPAALSNEGLKYERWRSLARRIHLIEDPALTALFVAERFARAVIRMRDGRDFGTSDRPTAGEPEITFAGDIAEKFACKAEPPGLGERGERIRNAIESLSYQRRRDCLA